MRPKLLTFSLAVIIFIIACNQKQSAPAVVKPASDLATDNLKGDIAQVESDTYLIDSTGKTGPLDSKTIEKFDSSGNVTSSVSMNGKDSIKSQSKFEHNEYGYFTSMETTGANNEKKSSLTIDYDTIGKYGVAKEYDSTGKLDLYYTDITSNEFGEVTGGKGYHPDSTLKVSFTNDYDSIYSVGGMSKDSLGKVIYSGRGVLNDKKEMTKYEDTTVSKDPKTMKETTKYTSNTYTYGGYDSHGNWTEETTIDDKGKPTKMLKRIITYR